MEMWLRQSRIGQVSGPEVFAVWWRRCEHQSPAARREGQGKRQREGPTDFEQVTPEGHPAGRGSLLSRQDAPWSFQFTTGQKGYPSATRGYLDAGQATPKEGHARPPCAQAPCGAPASLGLVPCLEKAGHASWHCPVGLCSQPTWVPVTQAHV